MNTPKPIAGFYEPERDDFLGFRWMHRIGRMGFAAARYESFLELSVLSEFHDLSQALTFRAGNQEETLRLLPGWRRVSIGIPADIDALAIEASSFGVGLPTN